MKNYDLYGLSSDNLEAGLASIERVVGVAFASHESSYHGGAYYRLGSLGQEHFILQRNFDPFENEWMEEGFKEVATLLYVNETERSDELQEALTMEVPGIRLLRRERA